MQNNLISFNKYFYITDVFQISNSDLLNYLSNITNFNYIIELKFIKKEHLQLYYNSIFNTTELEDHNLILEINKLKTLLDNNKIEIPIINIDYSQRYGC
jgi:hypothetical protein